ncbi:MAG: hypothetical protein R3E12_14405 [Candidatus Eisenbacteria bacterium]
MADLVAIDPFEDRGAFFVPGDRQTVAQPPGDVEPPRFQDARHDGQTRRELLMIPRGVEERQVHRIGAERSAQLPQPLQQHPRVHDLLAGDPEHLAMVRIRLLRKVGRRQERQLDRAELDVRDGMEQQVPSASRPQTRSIAQLARGQHAPVHRAPGPNASRDRRRVVRGAGDPDPAVAGPRGELHRGAQLPVQVRLGDDVLDVPDDGRIQHLAVLLWRRSRNDARLPRVSLRSRTRGCRRGTRGSRRATTRVSW